MSANKPGRLAESRKQRLTETGEILAALQFGPKQRNETAAYTLLALLDLRPDVLWADAQAPLRGITPVINFIAGAYATETKYFAKTHPFLPRRLSGLRRRPRIGHPDMKLATTCHAERTNLVPNSNRCLSTTTPNHHLANGKFHRAVWLRDP
jgi:hypothetical protein